MIFVLTSIVLFIIYFLKMDKKISYLEMYTTSIFSIVLQLLTDTFLEFKYKLYGYFDKGVDYETLVIIFFVFPAVSSIFLNHFPLKKHFYIKTIYILAWTLFSTLYEWICVKTDAFYYEKWELWYSALIYPFIYLIIIGNFLLIRKLLYKLYKANT